MQVIQVDDTVERYTILLDDCWTRLSYTYTIFDAFSNETKLSLLFAIVREISALSDFQMFQHFINVDSSVFDDSSFLYSF